MIGTTLMASEIAEQPVALARLLASGRAQVAEVAEFLKTRRPRAVLFAGRGTSANVGTFGRYLWASELNLQCSALTRSALTWYSARPDLRDVLVVAISQSGQSPDLLAAMEASQECGATVLAITNDAASDLADLADMVIDVDCGAERAVAATKSYTNSLLAIAMVAAATRGGDPIPEEQLCVAADEQLGNFPALARLAEELDGETRLISTGRGLSLATAQEAALKITETCLFPAMAFGAADLLHGPIAMVSPGFPVIAVDSHGRGPDYMAATFSALHERGARVMTLSPDGHGSAGIGVTSVRPPTVALAPIIEIIALQLLALEMSRRRGVSVDEPGGLSKVTLTR